MDRYQISEVFLAGVIFFVWAADYIYVYSLMRERVCRKLVQYHIPLTLFTKFENGQWILPC